jgi:hypothetical protein
MDEAVGFFGLGVDGAINKVVCVLRTLRCRLINNMIAIGHVTEAYFGEWNAPYST